MFMFTNKHFIGIPNEPIYMVVFGVLLVGVIILLVKAIKDSNK